MFNLMIKDVYRVESNVPSVPQIFPLLLIVFFQY